MCVKLETIDGVAVLTLDRPNAMNAMNLELLEALVDALDRVRAADDRALVLTGAGSAFCAGADLGYVRGALERGPTAGLVSLIDALHAAIRRIRALPVPVISAVEGPAVGAGLGLALAADLRVLGSGPRLVPGYLRIGVSPDGGVSWLLTRAIGGARTTELLLRNRTVDPPEALRLGLADVVVELEGALGRALQLAAEVAGTAPEALLVVRELIDRATVNTLDRQLDLERERVMELWSGRDFAEGVSAFLQKRKPSFARG
jgi:2-(1,2-epoxy-1,2-dihydrophenyl)acetyl-CoA isomerase